MSGITPGPVRRLSDRAHRSATWLVQTAETIPEDDTLLSLTLSDAREPVIAGNRAWLWKRAHVGYDRSNFFVSQLDETHHADTVKGDAHLGGAVPTDIGSVLGRNPTSICAMTGGTANSTSGLLIDDASLLDDFLVTSATSVVGCRCGLCGCGRYWSIGRGCRRLRFAGWSNGRIRPVGRHCGRGWLLGGRLGRGWLWVITITAAGDGDSQQDQDSQRWAQSCGTQSSS